MANIGLFWDNLADAGSYTGGSWESALPASNVGVRGYADVARSTDAVATSTRFNVDNGSAVGVRALALVAHNLSVDAQVRWSRGTTSGGNEVYAGSWVDAWRFTPHTYNGMRHAFIWILDAATSARYDTIEIDDTTNADGYVQIGRLFLGSGFVPEVNAQYGLQDGLRDLSGIDRSDSGALWVTARRTLRTVSFLLPRLTLSEGDDIHELQRVCGTSQEVLYVPEVSNTAASQRYGFLGTMDDLSPLEYPHYRNRAAGFRLTES